MMSAPVTAALAWTLVHFLWQGAAIGGAAFLLMAVFRGSSPARYGVGVAALVAMLATPIVTFAILAADGGTAPTAALGEMAGPASRSDDDATGAASGATTTLAPGVAVGVGADARVDRSGVARLLSSPAVSRGILLTWLAGVGFLAVRLAGGWFVARRLAGRGVRPVGANLQRLAAALADRLRLRHAVRVLESSRVAVPMLVGWMRPVVLLPTAALAGLSPTQLEALLAHELAHVRRHDYLVNLMQSMVETLLFYHPAVWWVSRQVRAEREHCCDEVAVGLCDRLVYVSALADLAAIETTPRLALAATDGSLLDRVRRILDRPGRRGPARPHVGWSALLVLLLAGAAGPWLVHDVGLTAWSAHDAIGQAPQVVDPDAPTRTGSGMSAHSTDGDRVEIRWTGAFRLSDDETTIEWIEPGRSVRITNGGRWFTTGVEIVAGSDGALDRHHFSSGFERPWEPDGRAYLEQAIRKLVLRTGLNARARVARLLASGGPDAVRAEIARLEADGARRTYYRELIAQADLPPAEVVALVREAADRMRSDSYRSQLITEAAPRVAGNEAATADLIAASTTIASDSYQRRTLTALMPDRPSPAVAAAVLDAAASIGSDSYRHQVLVAVAEQGGLTAATQPAYFALVDGMQSASYRGRVLRAVGTRPDADPAMVSAVLESVGGVRSASQRAALLRDFVAKGGLTTETAPAFFDLVATTSSGTYQQRVMNDVTAMPSLPAGVAAAFLDAARRVRGDTARAAVLMAFIEKHAVTGDNRARFLAAAESIDSRTYEDRVLAALVRAEIARDGGGDE